MDLARIRELLNLVAQSNVAEVEIEENDFKLVVRKTVPTVMMQPPPYPSYGMSFAPPAYPQAPPPLYPPAAAPPLAPAPAAASPPPAPAAAPAAAEEPADAGVVVRAPIVGTYYAAPAPDAEVFVQVGDQVKTGDVLCIIEAMKLMNEIECEHTGTLLKILVQNAEPVEYDQPLFVIEPA